MKRLFMIVTLLLFICSCGSTEDSSNLLPSDYTPVQSGGMGSLMESEMSGVLEGYNVITIMVETGISLAINEVLTPNLYKLKHEGINFTNNYCKNKTKVSEFIGMTGSAINNPHNYDILKLEKDFTLPNILSSLGYQTSYFHCNSSSYYNRNMVCKALGYENLYFSDVDDSFNWYWFDGNYPLDTEFYEFTKEYMIPEKSDKPFHSFWTTLSMHGPYNFGQTNIKKFTNLGYFDAIDKAEMTGDWINYCADDSNLAKKQYRAYQAAVMNFDDAIGSLLQRLEETKQLDNTLIVIYGDHDVYYDYLIGEPLSSYIYDETNKEYSPRYETMMLMYNSKMIEKYKEVYEVEEVVYTDFTSPYIIVPTVLDLLGYDYNPSNYVGTSIFRTISSLDNIFYSHELDAYMSNIVYKDNEGNIKYSNCNSTYLKEFENKVIELKNRLLYCELLYE